LQNKNKVKFTNIYLINNYKNFYKFNFINNILFFIFEKLIKYFYLKNKIVNKNNLVYHYILFENKNILYQIFINLCKSKYLVQNKKFVDFFFNKLLNNDKNKKIKQIKKI